MIRLRLVAPDVEQLHAAADRVATVLAVVGGSRRPRPRRDGDGYSLYLQAAPTFMQLAAPPEFPEQPARPEPPDVPDAPGGPR